MRASWPRTRHQGAAPVELRRFGARVRNGQDGVEEVELVLGEEQDPVAGQLVGDHPGGWSLLAFARQDVRLDEQGSEQPAAVARSEADGSFEFHLARGAYDLYAVDPAAPRFVRRDALHTTGGRWRVELPEAAAFDALTAEVHGDDGRRLAGARIEVGLRSQGELGPRHLAWSALESDARGAFTFAPDPAAELELRVAHAAVGRVEAHLAAHAGEASFVVPRAAFPQVACGRRRDGRRGPRCRRTRARRARPLASDSRFALHGGWSLRSGPRVGALARARGTRSRTRAGAGRGPGRSRAPRPALSRFIEEAEPRAGSAPAAPE
jgi:hypothetical protein